MCYQTKTALNYNNELKLAYRKRIYKNVFKSLRYNQKVIVVGFDAQDGLESKYLFETYGERVCRFVNIERDELLLKRWHKNVVTRDYYNRLESYNTDLLTFTKEKLNDLLAELLLLYPDSRVVLNLDGIAFICPTLLQTVKEINDGGLVDILVVSFQNQNAPRNVGPIRKEWVKERKEMFKRGIKDWANAKVRQQVGLKFTKLDDFLSRSGKRVDMRNQVFTRKAA